VDNWKTQDDNDVCLPFSWQMSMSHVGKVSKKYFFSKRRTGDLEETLQAINHSRKDKTVLYTSSASCLYIRGTQLESLYAIGYPEFLQANTQLVPRN
jgi:hypothetical protein